MPLTVTQVGARPGAKPHIPPPPPPESQPGEIQSGAGRLVSLRRMLRPRNGTSLRPKVIHSAKANRRPESYLALNSRSASHSVSVSQKKKFGSLRKWFTRKKTMCDGDASEGLPKVEMDDSAPPLSDMSSSISLHSSDAGDGSCSTHNLEYVPKDQTDGPQVFRPHPPTLSRVVTLTSARRDTLRNMHAHFNELAAEMTRQHADSGVKNFEEYPSQNELVPPSDNERTNINNERMNLENERADSSGVQSGNDGAEMKNDMSSTVAKVAANDVDFFRQMVTDGIHLEMCIPHHSAHICHLTITNMDSLLRLNWRYGKNLRTSGGVDIHECTGVVKGKQTCAFREECNAWLWPESCFSILTQDRTVDLIAHSEHERDSIVQKFKHLIWPELEQTGDTSCEICRYMHRKCTCLLVGKRPEENQNWMGVGVL
eukprot:308671_1